MACLYQDAIAYSFWPTRPTHTPIHTQQAMRPQAKRNPSRRHYTPARLSVCVLSPFLSLSLCLKRSCVRAFVPAFAWTFWPPHLGVNSFRFNFSPRFKALVVSVRDRSFVRLNGCLFVRTFGSVGWLVSWLADCLLVSPTSCLALFTCSALPRVRTLTFTYTIAR